MKGTARECHEKITSSECHNLSISLYGIHPQLLKRIIIKTTARPRKCKIKLMSRERNNQKNYPITKLKGLPCGHNQKNCQGQCVSQTKGTLGTTTFKMTTREYHNQNDLKGVSLFKGIPGSITNQTTVREYDKSVF